MQFRLTIKTESIQPQAVWLSVPRLRVCLINLSFVRLFDIFFCHKRRSCLKVKGNIMGVKEESFGTPLSLSIFIILHFLPTFSLSLSVYLSFLTLLRFLHLPFLFHGDTGLYGPATILFLSFMTHIICVGVLNESQFSLYTESGINTFQKATSCFILWREDRNICRFFYSSLLSCTLPPHLLQLCPPVNCLYDSGTDSSWLGSGAHCVKHWSLDLAENFSTKYLKNNEKQPVRCLLIKIFAFN